MVVKTTIDRGRSLYSMPLLPTIHIQQTHQIAEDTILLPSKIVKKLKIDVHFISIVVGTNQFFVKVIPSSKTTRLSIHASLVEKLGLTTAITHGIPLHFRYDQKHAIFTLGPVLAILVNPIKEDIQLPFGNITPFAVELSEVAKKRGILLYFITPDELSLHGKHMQGWFYSTEWSKETLPFPNVVYNRIANRVIEQGERVQHFLAALGKLDIPYFNSRFFNKDEVFKALEKDETVSAILPHSELLHQLAQIRDMLKMHRMIYIKPIHGRLGRGIYRIHYLADSSKFKLEQANQPLTMAKYFSSIERLLAYLKPKLSKQAYQIQQGINLIHSNRKPIDFRVLVQKNGKGLWTVTSIVARTAADDNLVSNIAKGGSIGSVAAVLPTTSLAGMYTPEGLTHELKRAALLIAKAFEANFNAVLGELGIDLALDERGKVWLLEINGKPSKLTKAKVQTVKIRPSVKMLIAYSLFISGFKESERST